MLVVVGRIGRAHGIRGDLGVDIRTDEPERRFAPGSSVRYQGGTLTITSVRQHSGRLIVHFAGIDDRNAAEALHGKTLEVEVDASEAPEDPEEFYDHQLLGLQARAGERVVGTVTQVIHLPGQDSLAIDTGAGELLVPFVLDLVPEINVLGGYLRIAEVPGLLDPENAESAGQS